MDEGITSKELCTLLGISVRTLRLWQTHRLIARPGGGKSTRFGPAAVLRAQAARALRAQRLGLRVVASQLDGKTDDELRAIAGLATPPVAGPPGPGPAPAAAPAAAPAPAPAAAPAPAPAPAPPAAPAAPAAPAPAGPTPTSEPVRSSAPDAPLPTPAAASPAAASPAAPERVAEPPATEVPSHAASTVLGTGWRHIELMPGLVLLVRDDAPDFVRGLARTIASGRVTAT